MAMKTSTLILRTSIAMMCMLVYSTIIWAQSPIVLGFWEEQNTARTARAFRAVEGNAFGEFTGDSIFFSSARGLTSVSPTAQPNLFNCMLSPAAGTNKRRTNNTENTYVFKIASTGYSEIGLLFSSGTTAATTVNLNNANPIQIGDSENGPWTPITDWTSNGPVNVPQAVTGCGGYLTISNLNIPSGKYVRIALNSSQQLVEAFIIPISGYGEAFTATTNPKVNTVIPKSGVIEIIYNKIVTYSFCQGSVMINGFDMSAFVELNDLRTTLTIPYDASDWNGRDSLVIELSEKAIFDNTNTGLPLTLVFLNENSPPPPPSNENYVLTFRVDGFDAVVNQQTNTIVAELPHTADLTSVEVVYTASEKATVQVNGANVPATHLQNFASVVNYVVTAESGAIRTYSVTITKANQTSTQNFLVENFSIHPNPVFDVLYIEAENLKQIEIIDLSGRVVIRQTQISGKKQVNVSHLKEGLYFVRLTTENNRVVTEKFVKK
jgi:hypothetical protein